MDEVYLMQKLLDFKGTEYYGILTKLADKLSNNFMESLLTENEREIEFKNKINGLREFFEFINENIRAGENKIKLEKLSES